jgi:hypothetical protein
MKTKDFNVAVELEKIAQKISNGETLFAIYGNDKNDELTVLTAEKENNDIICTIAAILTMSLTGKGDEGIDRVAHIILEALKLVQTSGSIAGLKLATEMLKGVAEKARLLDNKDEEGCGDCELIRVCNEQDAIKYRKEHGIPNPKKATVGERKMKGGRKIKVN